MYMNISIIVITSYVGLSLYYNKPSTLNSSYLNISNTLERIHVYLITISINSAYRKNYLCTTKNKTYFAFLFALLVEFVSPS